MKNSWVVLLIATFLFAASAPLITRGQPQPSQPQSQAPPPTYDSHQPEEVPPDLDPADQPPTPEQQQQEQQEQQQQASSQPGVARVSVIQGNASIQRGDNGEWSAATVNTPLEAGDRLSTGNDGRAELQLNGSDVARLSSDSSAKIATLNRNQIQIQVDQGLVTYSVLRDSGAAVEIDTPNVAIRPRGEGQFRILVNSSAETQVIVRSGSADIATPQGSTTVTEGQMITIAGTDNPQYQIANAPARDEWDNWNNDRNKVILDAQSWQHTDRYYTGSEDLDGYGTWQNVPDYGPVWVPSVAPGWAPYRAGRWVYEPYYGWTWVSYEPWGWAPYHYGRWFVYGGSWAWWPGPVVAYPAYYPLWAPAYVSFFGWGGGGWGIGFGFGWGWGHVGWLPIGPCDWYHPWYGRWGGGVHVYSYASIHGTTFVHNGFAPLTRGGLHPYSNLAQLNSNARLREGFTSMEGRDFGRGAVPSHQMGINDATLRQASFVSGRMPVEPGRGSYSASGRPAAPSTVRNAPSHMFNSSMAPHESLATNRSSQFGRTSDQSHNDLRAQTASPGRGFNAPNPGTQSRTFAAPSSDRSAALNDRNHSYEAGNSRLYGAPSARSNWHTFTPPNNSNRAQDYRGYSGPSENTRQYQAPSSNYGREPQSRGYYGSNSSQYRSPSYGSRNGYANGYNYRPPLNLHQPVVRPRTYSAPGYRGNPGAGYRAPSSGGGYHGGGGGSHGGGGFHGGGGGHGGRGR
ncbi:MAG TPA: FecR family protein [Candidatus Acidoferrum sp.]|nr:FecR family protein [Candidatus Acidoferrum sp.]